ncbi:MAG: hypothetical protein ACKO2P_12230 [Planctomycetota bacterium]
MSLQFTGLLPLWLGLSLAGIVSLLSFRGYLRETRELGGGLRWLLPMLRSAAFLLGALILTGPVLHHRTIIGEPGRLDIFLDGSASMQLTDRQMSVERRVAVAQGLGWLDAEQKGIDDPAVRDALLMVDQTPRWQRLEQALTTGERSVLKKLGEQHELHLHVLRGPEVSAVSDELLAGMGGSGAGESLFGEFSAATDLTAALRAVAGSGSRKDAVTLLLTDGRHNSGDSPVTFARELSAAGSRVVTVAIGASEEPPDLAILKLEHPQSVFRRDQVRGVVVVHDRAPAGVPFVLQIRSGEDVLWQQQAVALGTGERRIDFSFPVNELVEELADAAPEGIRLNAVPLELTAAITPLADEASADNNEAPLRLSAVVQPQRVLLLEGRSRWETRYLRNLFERDEQWELNAVLAGPGTQQAELVRGTAAGQFPETRDQLFGYDLVILGELEPSLLSAVEQRWLRDFVELRGGGLIVMDGQRRTLPDFPQETLGEMMPVSWSGSPAVAAAALRLTDRGATEPMLKVEPQDEQNRAFWSRLPAPQAVIPVLALPGSEVLLEAEVPGTSLPVLVTRRSGAGQVLYFATDETWRWRYKAADLWHQRIWNQLARSVMARSFSVSSEYLAVDSGSVCYREGQAVDIRIRLQDANGRPAVETTADALIWRDGRVAATVSLKPDEHVPGIYRGRVTGLTRGEYEVSVQASGFSEDALQARSRFAVQGETAQELREGSANEALLQELATAGGGEFLQEEDLQRLPEILSVYTNGRIVESESLLWQSYWWFSAMLLLLTCEWLLRRRAGLM